MLCRTYLPRVFTYPVYFDLRTHGAKDIFFIVGVNAARPLIKIVRRFKCRASAHRAGMAAFLI